MTIEMKPKLSLVGKLVEIMGELERVPKRGFNKHQNYAYVMEADVEDMLRKLLVKYRVMVYPQLKSVSVLPPTSDPIKGLASNQRLTTVEINWHFEDADSGETRTVTLAGQGSDPNDKGIYKAFTGANKYMALKTFHLPTGDDPEADESVDFEAGKLAAEAVAKQKEAEANWHRREAEGMARIAHQETVREEDLTPPKSTLEQQLKASLGMAQISKNVAAELARQGAGLLPTLAQSIENAKKAKINQAPPPTKMKPDPTAPVDDGRDITFGILKAAKRIAKPGKTPFLACKLVMPSDEELEFSVFDHKVYANGQKLWDMIERAVGKPCKFVTVQSHKRDRKGKPYINYVDVLQLGETSFDELGPILERERQSQFPEDMDEYTL
jgi:hypothetical protein